MRAQGAGSDQHGEGRMRTQEVGTGAIQANDGHQKSEARDENGMLMLVFSDTHGDVSVAETAIRRFPQATHILHLGDNTRDAARLALRHPEKIVLGVAGNCDWEADPAQYPAERMLSLEGKSILLTHGHRYGVKSGYGKLMEHAMKQGCDLILFGHTHIAVDIERDGCHLLNPGSTTLSKGMEGPSYAIVEIGHGRMETRLMQAEFD